MTLPITPYQREFDTKSRRILVTGTRSPFSLELCRQFRHSGHRVYAADSTRVQLARGSSYVTKSFVVSPPASQLAEFAQQLDRIVEDERIDIVIPTGEEIFHIARVRDQLSSRCEWFLPTLPVLTRLHDKYEFTQWLKELGLRAPKTERVTERSQVDAIVRRINKGEKLVLKPAFSRFSAKILICPSSAETVYSAVGEASESFPWVCQEFLPGRQICSYAVAQNGQLKAYSDYATTFNISRGVSIHFECMQQSEARGFVSDFIQKTAFTGQIGFDFIETPDGSLTPIECNPRTTSGVHLFELGSGLPECFIDGTANTLLATKGHSAQIALGMVAYGWRNNKLGIMRWLRSLLTTKDVIFSWVDPLPTLWFVAGFFRNTIVARRGGMTTVEASTADSEWNGEP